jgi:Glycosyl transferases group 1
VAKRGYVRTRSGWVSDRTACYLASGKPAVVQSTGFEDVLPVGEGLLTFQTLDEAVEAVAAVERDYARHARAARRLAERRFDSAVVLPRILERAGL